MSSLFRENKTLFIIIAIGIFLLELEIFAIAALKSGRKSWLEIRNTQGNVIHMTEGNNLSSFNKYYFEKTFGPLDQYQVNLISREEPFPFRAWFSAAIGIPVGAVLLFAFISRAVSTLFYGQRLSSPQTGDQPAEYETRLEKILGAVGRLNIFAIGFLILVGVLSYWIVPNFIVYLGSLGIETVIRFKWFFIALALVFAGIILWIIYLRYLLARRTIDSRMELEKFRLQLEASGTNTEPVHLIGNTNTSSQIDWNQTSKPLVNNTL
ncbi:MAG: hypothetical protein AB7S77_12540 [Desulfatirhabdiaceae bacterium]